MDIHKIKILDVNFLSKHRIMISRLPYIFSIAKAVSLTIEAVNALTCDTVISFISVLCTIAIKCVQTELVSGCDGS